MQCYSHCWSNHCCSNPWTTIEKLSVGYLQNYDLQFPNLTHACPRLLFTLVFSYKKSTHDIKRWRWTNIEEIERKRMRESKFKGNKSAPVENSTEFLDSICHRSLLVPFLTLWLNRCISWSIFCCLFFFFRVWNKFDCN